MLIVFENDVVIPRMPFLDSSQSRDSGENQARLSAIQAQVDAIKAQRAPRYAAITQSLNRDFGARVAQSYWLINGVLAEVPIAAIEGISRRPDVMYIQPEQSDDPPPSHGTANHVSNGRSLIASDAFYYFTNGNQFIALLDSGIRSTHTLLSNPKKFDWFYDCTDGTCGSDGTPTDTVNHGTSSAAILVGNSNLTDTHRGVTAARVDSFNVYGSVNNLNINAAVLGFQAAVGSGDKVIVAEMQALEAVTGAIATAADNAFDANRVVVAANGNFGPNSATVRSPALAHKVIGVGAEDVVTTVLEGYSSRGPTSDNRTKPDITMPTNTLTASNASDTATWIFSGTSGATPYAGGIAAALSAWFATSSTTDAGLVYSTLIANGNSSPTNNAFDNNRGAGRSILATSGGIHWGKVSIFPTKSISVPIPVPSGRKNIDLAIWWPESATQKHSDIDLDLFNPSGALVASSNRVDGVFEKVNYEVGTSLPTGNWTVKITGFNGTLNVSQTVYWTLHQR